MDVFSSNELFACTGIVFDKEAWIEANNDELVTVGPYQTGSFVAMIHRDF